MRGRIPLSRMAAGAALALGLALAAAAAQPASAAPGAVCLQDCTVDFPAGAQTTWTVPAGISDVQVTVAAGSGSDGGGTGEGGAGGSVTVDLGGALAGTTLHLLAGRAGVAGADPGEAAPGGEGSYVAAPGRLLVAAGGGGGAGDYQDFDGPHPAGGGGGGFSAGSADGGDGADGPYVLAAGRGAVGAAPGQPAPHGLLLRQGGQGGVTAVAADGTISPGLGGAAAVLGNYPVASGGGGYAGGGGGSAALDGQISLAGAGAGGGGSGYLAPGLVAQATAAHRGDGVISFRFSFAPAVSAPATASTGSSATARVSGLPEGAAFALELRPVAGGPALPAGSGVADATGGADVQVSLPASGAFTLALVVDGADVATAAIAVADPVIAPAAQPTPAAPAGQQSPAPSGELAATGSDLPLGAVGMSAALIALGAVLVAFAFPRRRRGGGEPASHG